MRDGEVYRAIAANNEQIGNAFNQLRMEVVTLQAALISEVLRSQSLEEVLLESATAGPAGAGVALTKDAIEARFKTKLEAYEKKIEERKKAQAEAQVAAAGPKIVAPTAEEMAKVTMPTVSTPTNA